MYVSSKKQKETAAAKPHLKKGDNVLVLTGKDRGKQGRVLRVLSAKGKAIVERVNFTKKHTKPNPGKNQQGGILEREAPIQMSNLQVVCPSCNEPSRTGSHRTPDGVKRFCRKCDAEM